MYTTLFNVYNNTIFSKLGFFFFVKFVYEYGLEWKSSFKLKIYLSVLYETSNSFIELFCYKVMLWAVLLQLYDVLLSLYEVHLQLCRAHLSLWHMRFVFFWMIIYHCVICRYICIIMWGVFYLCNVLISLNDLQLSLCHMILWLGHVH